ncbi:hypothetical protein ACET3Z_009980 [Daucus carota]
MLLNANKCQDVTKMNIMFNESVAYIEETMVKLGPFDGVLGMSMGVALTKVQDLKCVVVISGGENDFAKLSAIELLESFVDPFVILHPGGHEMDVGRSGPGPLDGSLLTLQSVHRSEVVWNNREEEQLSAMQRAIDPYAPDLGLANHILQDMVTRVQRRPTEQAPARPRARAPAGRRGRPPVTPVVPEEGTYYTHVGSSHLAGTSYSAGHDGAEDQHHTPPPFTQEPSFGSSTYRFGSPPVTFTPMMSTSGEGFTTPLPAFAAFAGDSSPWAYAPVRPPRAAAQPSEVEDESDHEEPSEHEQRQQPPRAAKGKGRRCHTGSHFFGHTKK